jgi:hypothetical protein
MSALVLLPNCVSNTSPSVSDPLFFLLLYGIASKLYTGFPYSVIDMKLPIQFAIYDSQIFYLIVQYQFGVKEFWGKKTFQIAPFCEKYLVVLFSPISPHQFCIKINALCIKSQMVLINFHHIPE